MSDFMSEKSNISADFPYKSNYIDVFGAKIHYIDEGEGDPILFLHGIPTSSYLWRNVIPHVCPCGRCIAPDLIGMGKSDKLDIPYRVFDHIKYMEGFIEALNLKNVTLVLHGWGSVIGFDYAMRHPDNIKGLAFLEAYLRSESSNVLSLSMQQMHELLCSPCKAYEFIVHSDHFVEKILSSGSLRRLTDKELCCYKEPFSTPELRRLLCRYLQDFPICSVNKDVVQLICDYSERLMESTLPKLMLYGFPGFHTTIDAVQWAKEHLDKLTIVDIGDALHYAQESNPEEVGQSIAEWYQGIE